MTASDLLADLKKKNYRPIYVLHGEEAYYIDQISDYIENKVLNETEKAFNQTLIYGRDADFMTVVDTARRYPMMSPYQVVIIKEAQDMKNMAELLSYIEKPMPTTILVFCHKHKKLDMRTKFGKALSQHAVVFESKPLYDNQLPDWIKSYLKDKKLTIQGDAAFLIAENLGTELSKVANELDKLAINLPAGSEVTMKDVEANIGISKEYNIFELQKAISTRNVSRANRIVTYFAQNPKSSPLVMTISSLYGYFSKVYMLHFLKNSGDKVMSDTLQLRSDFFLKEYKLAVSNYNRAQTEHIIGLLRQYDLRSKGIENDNASEGDLLKELIWRMMHI